MKSYKINRTVEKTGIKTAQVLALVTIISAMELETVTSEQIAAQLKSPAGKILVTRQDPMLIFRYYIRELKKVGVIEELESAKSAKVTKHDFVDGAGI